jgi:uncharacterized damage-inducible protein DinB
VSAESGALFLAESRRLLADDYLPRIRLALESLPEGDLWWRPNEASNSAGNLLLHLAGNVRQWIVGGVGGEPDRRRRDEEFDADAGSVSEVLAVLEAAVGDAAATLASLDPDSLTGRIAVQGRETTRLAAIYHAVEHFSMHTGQLIWVVKARTSQDLELYEPGDDGHPYPAW